jgi:hypothetical protein
MLIDGVAQPSQAPIHNEESTSIVLACCIYFVGSEINNENLLIYLEITAIQWYLINFALTIIVQPKTNFIIIDNL